MTLIKILKKLLFSVMPPEKMPDFMLKKWCDHHYYRVFHRHVDFKNPQSFNEKIQWYAVFYRNPVLHRIVDKITFKDYIEEKLGPGYTPKLYAAWRRYKDVDFSGLTPPYVLKSNCSSGGENIVFVNSAPVDEETLREKIRPWFDKGGANISVHSNRYAYWGVTPSVFAEEYVAELGEGATDYKFHCFDGKPYCILSARERFSNGVLQGAQFAFYDMEWNLLDVARPDQTPSAIPKPEHFKQMVEIAEKLSAGFPFVRVDFYDTERGPLLSEMTFYPAGGFKPFVPESFDYELGKRFVLPQKQTYDGA